MANWKKQLSEIFPEMRRAFHLEYEASVGASHYWHTGVSSGIILPIKGINRCGGISWQTPYAMTGGGKILKYKSANKGEIIVSPKLSHSISKKISKEQYAYLISINPAPGLEKAFRKIDNNELKGLLAHELAEVSLATKVLNFHDRMNPHGLAEEEVDKIAAEKGYKSQVVAYLELLRDNVDSIHERPVPKDDFLDSLVGMIGLAVIDMNKHEASDVTESVKRELETRLKSLSNL